MNAPIAVMLAAYLTLNFYVTKLWMSDRLNRPIWASDDAVYLVRVGKNILAALIFVAVTWHFSYWVGILAGFLIYIVNDQVRRFSLTRELNRTAQEFSENELFQKTLDSKPEAERAEYMDRLIRRTVLVRIFDDERVEKAIGQPAGEN